MRHFILIWFSLILLSLNVSAEVSAPASLRQQLPENTVAYFRIPSLWGLFSGEHDSSLKAAQAHPAHKAQVIKIMNGMRNKPQYAELSEDMPMPLPVINLLYSDLRSPLEVAILMPPNAPPTSAVGLFRVKLNLSSLQAANEWLQDWAQFPKLSLQQAFDDKGMAILKTDKLPLLLHFSSETQYLHMMVGVLATLDSFSQTLEGLKEQTEHPMYTTEQQIDSSGQGLFTWLNLEKLLPMMQATLPPSEKQKLQMSGLDKARALALGYGSSQGKGRFQLLLDAPKAGYRSLLPPITNYLDVSTAGEPRILFGLNIPIKALFDSAHTFANTQMPPLQQELQKIQKNFTKTTGLKLDEVLGIFGDEILVFSDEVGEFVAIRLADKAGFTNLLKMLVDKYQLPYQTHKAHGTVYHHLQTPLPLPDEKATNPESKLLLTMLKRIKSHYYWIEEGNYIVLAKVPQLLFDRSQYVNRVVLKQWLKNTQKQSYESSLLLLSANLDRMPRLLYSLYLQMLLVLGDLADDPIDIFALPSATELNLPQDGTYGVNLFLGEQHSGLAFTFENNPLEFMLNMYGGGSAGAIAAVGIMSAIAIPAYTDYLKRAKIAEGVGLLAGLKTPAEEFLAAKGRLPTVEEVGGRSNGKYTRRIYLLEDGNGYAAEFRDSKLGGRVLLQLNIDTMKWSCSGDRIDSKFLPARCR